MSNLGKRKQSARDRDQDERPPHAKRERRDEAMTGACEGGPRVRANATVGQDIQVAESVEYLHGARSRHNGPGQTESVWGPHETRFITAIQESAEAVRRLHEVVHQMAQDITELAPKVAALQQQVSSSGSDSDGSDGSDGSVAGVQPASEREDVQVSALRQQLRATEQRLADRVEQAREQWRLREEALTCPVSLELLDDALLVTCCGWSFAGDSFARVVAETDGRCPICRRRWGPSPSSRNRVVALLLDLHKQERALLWG